VTGEFLRNELKKKKKERVKKEWEIFTRKG
jgi:hypothetical protein